MRKILAPLSFVVFLASCGSGGPAPSEEAASRADNVKYYDATGTVIELLGDHARIEHDAIPGFMDAMTMSFEVAEPSLLEGIEPGMDVAFRVAVADRSAVVDRIEPGERRR